jgi:hypothetical protein
MSRIDVSTSKLEVLLATPMHVTTDSLHRHVILIVTKNELVPKIS